MARILVIEDNPANLELMTYLLQAFGHTTFNAADGNAGLEAALNTLPDLVVCDVQLPGLDGYAIARRLKADPQLQTTPLIAVTALAMVGDRDQILAAGFDGYVSKPVVPETFVGQIEAFLPHDKLNTIVRPQETNREADAANSPIQTGVNILVVDDNWVNLDLMRSVLEPFGYTVITAASVAEALLIARAQPPDLIVSDLHMPDQTGFDLIRALKSDPQLQSITILIHSATIRSEQDRMEAIKLGATSFITRPMEPSVILSEIAANLRTQSER